MATQDVNDSTSNSTPAGCKDFPAIQANFLDDDSSSDQGGGGGVWRERGGEAERGGEWGGEAAEVWPSCCRVAAASLASTPCVLAKPPPPSAPSALARVADANAPLRVGVAPSTRRGGGGGWASYGAQMGTRAQQAPTCPFRVHSPLTHKGLTAHPTFSMAFDINGHTENKACNLCEIFRVTNKHSIKSSSN
ncbi:hypothetical protein Taro_047109 [Colocasia esculenta]|uniref:Uncharacterized protein n=1 Tax=Colocasia esculenta TaxID=4460 RepID=A0A843WVD6_COLES|nr:hypothetical protein [Colocasia esculenta]